MKLRGESEIDLTTEKTKALAYCDMVLDYAEKHHLQDNFEIPPIPGDGAHPLTVGSVRAIKASLEDITLRSAECIGDNIRAIDAAILTIRNDDQRRSIASCFTYLCANLYAVYYDVLPVIRGQKSWPEKRDPGALDAKKHAILVESTGNTQTATQLEWLDREIAAADGDRAAMLASIRSEMWRLNEIEKRYFTANNVLNGITEAIQRYWQP